MFPTLNRLTIFAIGARGAAIGHRLPQPLFDCTAGEQDQVAT